MTKISSGTYAKFYCGDTSYRYDAIARAAFGIYEGASSRGKLGGFVGGNDLAYLKAFIRYLETEIELREIGFAPESTAEPQEGPDPYSPLNQHKE